MFRKTELMNLGVYILLAETGQTLTHFYSIDRFGNPPDAAEKRSGGRKLKASGKHVSSEISPALQKIIWNLPPSATNHFKGKLSLCIGMPIIIRHNIMMPQSFALLKGRKVMLWDGKQAEAYMDNLS